jgi:hypothetical protein
MLFARSSNIDFLTCSQSITTVRLQLQYATCVPRPASHRNRTEEHISTVRWPLKLSDATDGRLALCDLASMGAPVDI